MISTISVCSEKSKSPPVSTTFVCPPVEMVVSLLKCLQKLHSRRRLIQPQLVYPPIIGSVCVGYLPVFPVVISVRDQSNGTAAAC